MALKLLLVFVEYAEFNTMLLLQAISFIDTRNGQYMLSVCDLLKLLLETVMFFSMDHGRC